MEDKNSFALILKRNILYYLFIFVIISFPSKFPCVWDERTEKAEIIEFVGNEYRLLDDLFFFLVIESTCLFFYLFYNVLIVIVHRRYTVYDKTLNVCSMKYVYNMKVIR